MRPLLIADDGKKYLFKHDEPKRVDFEDGFIMVTADLEIADGTRYRGVVSLDTQSSCEHYGTHFITEKGIAEHPWGMEPEERELFYKTLGKTEKEVLPYKYRYDYGLVHERDHHIDEKTGWSS